MSFIKKVAIHTGIQIVGKALSAFLGLCALFVLTRLLGPENFGTFHIITVIVTSIGIIADMGMYLVALKELSHTEHTDTHLFPDLLGARITISAICYLLSPLVIIFFPYSLGLKIAIFITALINISNSISQLAAAVFQAKFKTHFSAYADSIGKALLLIIVYIALQTHHQSTLTLSLVAVIAGSFATMIAHIIFLKKYTSITPRFSVQSCLRIIRTSWPLALSIVFTLVYAKADSVVLSLFKPITDVGMYGVAYRMLETLSTIPIIIMSLFIPRLSAYWTEGDTQSFNTLISAAFQSLSVIAAACISIAVLVASPFMALVAGKEFLTAPENLGILSVLFILLMIATSVIFLGAAFTQTIVCINKQRSMLRWYIIVAITALAGYVIYIPLYSYYAAAGITILAEAGIALAAWNTMRRTTHFRMNILFTIRVFVIAFGIAAFVSILNRGLFATIAIYAILYCAVIYAFGIPRTLAHMTRTISPL